MQCDDIMQGPSSGGGEKKKKLFEKNRETWPTDHKVQILPASPYRRWPVNRNGAINECKALGRDVPIHISV